MSSCQARAARSHAHAAQIVALAAHLAWHPAEYLSWSRLSACFVGNRAQLLVHLATGTAGRLAPSVERAAGSQLQLACLSPSGSRLLYAAVAPDDRTDGQVVSVWLMEGGAAHTAGVRMLQLHHRLATSELAVSPFALAWHPSEKFWAALTTQDVLVCCLGGRIMQRISHSGLDFLCREAGNARLAVTPEGDLLHVRLGRDRAVVLGFCDSYVLVDRAAKRCAAAPIVARPIHVERSIKAASKQVLLHSYKTCKGVVWFLSKFWSCFKASFPCMLCLLFWGGVIAGVVCFIVDVHPKKRKVCSCEYEDY